MKSGSCEKCGTFRRLLERDHKTPKRLGGTDESSNIQYLCSNCHQDKSIDEGSFANAKGRTRTPEHCAKISAAQKGKPKSEAHRIALSGPKSIAHRAALSQSKRDRDYARLVVGTSESDEAEFLSQEGECELSL